MGHMNYSLLKNSIIVFSLKDLIILGFGIIAVSLQLFFLPFHIWDAGVARPWYMLHGLIPYRDFVWMRMPFDLFLLAGWYKIFGANGYSYQIFIYILLIVLSILVFSVGRLLLRKFYFLPFVFFNIFLFPLFQNTEEGEILIGIFNLSLFLIIFSYFKNKNMWYLFIAGLISGTSFITKQNSTLVIVALFITISLDNYLNREKAVFFIRKITLYFLGIIIPIFCVFLYFIANNSFGDFLHYTLFVVIGAYYDSQVNQGNGLLIAFSYVSLLIPFILFFKKTGLNLTLGIFLILQILSLFPSLLPSFLSYRAFTAYPLISIVAGIMIGYLMKKQVGRTSKLVICVSIAIFVFFNYTFISSYASSIKGGEFRLNQYIKSYGEREYEIAKLIKKNSEDNEKIMNYGSEMIYVLSDRLPANKYVDPFPYLLYPYNKTAKVFADNPPRLVVYDKSLPNDHIGLDKWPFIDYLHRNYDIVKQFDENIILYKHKSK